MKQRSKQDDIKLKASAQQMEPPTKCKSACMDWSQYVQTTQVLRGRRPESVKNVQCFPPWSPPGLPFPGGQGWQEAIRGYMSHPASCSSKASEPGSYAPGERHLAPLVSGYQGHLGVRRWDPPGESDWPWVWEGVSPTPEPCRLACPVFM